METQIEISLINFPEYMNSTFGLAFAHPGTNHVAMIAIIVCDKIEHLLCDKTFYEYIKKTPDFKNYISNMTIEKLFNSKDNIYPANIANLIKKLSTTMIDIKNEFKFVFKYNGKIIEERLDFDYSKIEEEYDTN